MDHRTAKAENAHCNNQKGTRFNGADIQVCDPAKYISYNPFPDAEQPKGRVKKDNIQVLKPDQINAFFDAVSNQKYKTLFMLAVFSGARQGELLGLKWSDVDWETS